MESVIEKLGKASVTVEKDYHNSEKEYNKLTVVEEQGAFKTYISRKPVPVGKALTDREYWIPFSGVLESITFDYLKFKRDYASGQALNDDSIITRHILNRNVTREKIAEKSISDFEIDIDAIIEEKIKDRNVTSSKIALGAIHHEHISDFEIINQLIADAAVDTYKLKNKSVTEDKLSDSLMTMIKAATGVDTDLVADLDKLMKKVFPAEISCSFTPTDLQEKGTTCIVTINNFKAIVDGKEATIARKKVNDTIVVGTEYTEEVNDTKSFTIVIDAEGRSSTINKSVNFVYPIYTGFNLALVPTGELIQGLVKQGLRASLGTLTVTHTNDNTNKYFWICSPYNVNKVTTSGINIMSDFIKTDFTINGTTYHCYRLNKASSTDIFTFEIS